MYGRGVADSDWGWVYVSAFLKAPSGVGLDSNSNSGNYGASVDVSAVLNVFSMESGNYETTAQGMDEQQSSGCANAQLNVSPYLTRWWRFGFDNTDQCKEQWAYFVDCTHACSGASWVCRDTNQGTWIQGAGLRITVYGVPWCTPSTKAGSENAICRSASRRPMSAAHVSAGVGIALLALFAGGCGPEVLVAVVERQAREAVQREMATPVRTELTTCANQWGEGAFVTVSEAGDVSATPVWLYLGKGRTYALDTESARITPRLAMLNDAPLEDQNRASLTETSINEIRQWVVGRPCTG